MFRLVIHTYIYICITIYIKLVRKQKYKLFLKTSCCVFLVHLLRNLGDLVNKKRLKTLSLMNNKEHIRKWILLKMLDF